MSAADTHEGQTQWVGEEPLAGNAQPPAKEKKPPSSKPSVLINIALAIVALVSIALLVEMLLSHRLRNPIIDAVEKHHPIAFWILVILSGLVLLMSFPLLIRNRGILSHEPQHARSILARLTLVAVILGCGIAGLILGNRPVITYVAGGAGILLLINTIYGIIDPGASAKERQGTTGTGQPQPQTRHRSFMPAGQPQHDDDMGNHDDDMRDTSTSSGLTDAGAYGDQAQAGASAQGDPFMPPS